MFKRFVQHAMCVGLLAVVLTGCSTQSLQSSSLSVGQHIETFISMCKRKGLVEVDQMTAAISRFADMLLSGQKSESPKDPAAQYLVQKGNDPHVQIAGLRADVRGVTEATKAVNQAIQAQSPEHQDIKKLDEMIDISDQVGQMFTQAIEHLKGDVSTKQIQAINGDVNQYLGEAATLKKYRENIRI